MTNRDHPDASEGKTEATGPGLNNARRTRAEHLTEEEMNAAALAHGSVLLGFITGGLAGVATAFILWLIYREKSTYVAFQALQAITFQLLLTIATVVVGLAIVVSALTICLIPLALILLLGVIALPFAQVLYGLYAAYETYYGADFEYWQVGDFVRRQMTTTN
jgi:uncharacterized Tic20 family protein